MRPRSALPSRPRQRRGSPSVWIVSADHASIHEELGSEENPIRYVVQPPPGECPPAGVHGSRHRISSERVPEPSPGTLPQRVESSPDEVSRIAGLCSGHQTGIWVRCFACVGAHGSQNSNQKAQSDCIPVSSYGHPLTSSFSP